MLAGMSAVGSDGGNEKENLHGLRMLERNVDEYMDAKSGSDESSSVSTAFPHKLVNLLSNDCDR